jgi:hypothetical protein
MENATKKDGTLMSRRIDICAGSRFPGLECMAFTYSRTPDVTSMDNNEQNLKSLGSLRYPGFQSIAKTN